MAIPLPPVEVGVSLPNMMKIYIFLLLFFASFVYSDGEKTKDERYDKLLQTLEATIKQLHKQNEEIAVLKNRIDQLEKQFLSATKKIKSQEKSTEKTAQVDLKKEQKILQNLGGYLHLHRNDFGRGKYPDGFDDINMYVIEVIEERKINTDNYRYLYSNKLNDPDSATTILAYDLRFEESLGKVIVLFTDRHTTILEQKDFTKLFQKQKKELSECGIECSYQKGIKWDD